MRALAVALVIGGGLLLAAATAADWVREETTRDVGGVPVAEIGTSAGTEFAPALFRYGVLALCGGLLVLVLRGTPQRVLAVVVALLGLTAVVSVLLGWRAAALEPGALTPAVGAAGLGAVAVAAGGVAAAVRPAPPVRLGARYSLDEAEGDDEWEMVSDEEPPTMPP